MDKTTILGFLLGLAVIIGGLILGEASLQTLLNPEAILVVLGGTFSAVLISSSWLRIQQAFKAFAQIFHHDPYSIQDYMTYAMDVASFVRAEGMLSIQPMLNEVEIPMLRHGLSIIVDNQSEKYLRESIGTEIEASYRQEVDNARVFELAGGFAPTMGIMGAIIGLIHVAGSFHNPSQLGQGVAEAFCATLYGVALSNLFLLPVASKLRQKAREHWFQNTLLFQALLSIRSGEHPVVLKEKLEAFVSNVGNSSSQNQQMPQGQVYENNLDFEEDYQESLSVGV